MASRGNLRPSRRQVPGRIRGIRRRVGAGGFFLSGAAMSFSLNGTRESMYPRASGEDALGQGCLSRARGGHSVEPFTCRVHDAINLTNSWHACRMSKIFMPVPHPRIELRRRDRPVKVADMMPRGTNPIIRFNTWLAVKVTEGVGTMWCAYAFAALALVSLPAAIISGNPVVLVSWISQTFLQLVLLSIIIVGQNVLAAASDKRAEATYQDADAVLHTALQIQDHLIAQDHEIEKILASVSSLKTT